MRNLNEVAGRCMSMVYAIGIEPGEIKEFKVNYRAKSRWGMCKLLSSGRYEIEINADLLDERNSLKGLEETVLHEILHSVKGCMNHGPNWNAVVAQVNQAYGYNIKRVNSAEDKGAEYHRTNKVEYKYMIKCEGCGQEIWRSKMSKVIQHPEQFQCGRCHHKLIRVM